MAKIKVKRSKKANGQVKEENKQEDVVVLPPVRMSDDPTPKQVNKHYSKIHSLLNKTLNSLLNKTLIVYF